jgi:hypothetical protein
MLTPYVYFLLLPLASVVVPRAGTGQGLVHKLAGRWHAVTTSVGGMRWDRLFADLEGQAAAIAEAELETELADRVRVELGQTLLINRLRAQEQRTVTLTVEGVGQVHGLLAQVGADWLLLQAPEELIVPAAAVVSVSGLPTAAVNPDGVPLTSSRLRMTAALRAVAVDRCPVTVTLRTGSMVTGTPDRVGADFVDLALHELAEAPRPSSIRGRLTVAFAALGAIRRSRGGWG